jgi:exopolysaccharide biosynthesis WecB/TagA/CpsF family protein
MQKIISLELNEVNFDFVQEYCARGELPTFKRMLGNYQLFETVAEKSYPQLEPWIQWPTVYSGKTYAEHGVFRLGDICNKDHDQIWELLESDGISVGAVSPMNAAHRCKAPDFFIPDPWTVTKVGGDRSLQRLHSILGQMVNDNSHDERGLASTILALLPHFVRYALPSSVLEYARMGRRAVQYKWARAVVLDRFLADLFLRLRRRHGTRFATIFLNAGAHIQHHHMFDASVYKGKNANPSWYSDAKQKGIDPLLFVYQCYDGILAEMLREPNTRVLVTTGLSQYPNERCMFNYRFKSHADSLARLGIEGFEVAPRMSRDFLLVFPSNEKARGAEDKMRQVRCAGGPLFTVENRGLSLFCQIGYFGPVEAFASVEQDGRTFDLTKEVALVSIENGLHRTTGFHIDTAISARGNGEIETIPLTDIFYKMRSALIEADGPKLRPTPKHSVSSEPDSITARVLEANGVAGRARIPTMPSRHVLGMRVDLLSTKEAVSRITDAAESGRAGYCCVTNVHQCIMTYDDPAFRKVVNGAELVISDSTILRSSLGLCYGVKMPPPMRGAELMNALCAAAAEASVPVALIGGKTDEVLGRLKRVLHSRYPSLNIPFAYSPPFSTPSTEEAARLIHGLRQSGARLVLVGLGCPKQERWMSANYALAGSFMVGVGAAFDYNSGAVKSSPPWVHRVGLEWLYRLASEPRRLWRRYLYTSPRFIALLLGDLVRNRGSGG